MLTTSKKASWKELSVPCESIKLHRELVLANDIFCKQTHLLHCLQHKDFLLHSRSFADLWGRGNLTSLHGLIQHELLTRLCASTISGNPEFAALKLTTVFPSLSILNWGQHHNIVGSSRVCFLNEMIFLVCHNLPITSVLCLIVICIVLCSIRLHKDSHSRVLLALLPCEIMKNCCIHNRSIATSFGVNCQAAKIFITV